MKNRWGKGDPVNLSDLLRITPIANEIMQLSEELGITTNDLMWIVNQIIDNSEGDITNFDKVLESGSPDLVNDAVWEELELEALDECLRAVKYMINVKINSNGKFPEIGFKAGINEKEDILSFFEMIVEMLEKIE